MWVCVCLLCFVGFESRFELYVSTECAFCVCFVFRVIINISKFKYFLDAKDTYIQAARQGRGFQGRVIEGAKGNAAATKYRNFWEIN